MAEVPKVPTRYGLFSDSFDDGIVGSPFGPEPGYAEEMYANNPLFNQLGPGQGQGPMMLPPTQMTMGMMPQGPQMPMQGGQGMPMQGGPMQQGPPMPPQGMPPQGGGGMPPQGQMPPQQMPPPQGGPMGMPQPGDTSAQGPYSAGPISRLGQWLKAQNPQDLAMSGAGFIQGITNPEIPFQVAQQMRQERMQQEQIMQSKADRQERDKYNREYKQEQQETREYYKWANEVGKLTDNLRDIRQLDEFYEEHGHPDPNDREGSLQKLREFEYKAVRKEGARESVGNALYNYLRAGIPAKILNKETKKMEPNFKAAYERTFSGMGETLTTEWADEWNVEGKLRDIHDSLIEAEEFKTKYAKHRLASAKRISAAMDPATKSKIASLEKQKALLFSEWKSIRGNMRRPEMGDLEIWSTIVAQNRADEADIKAQMDEIDVAIDALQPVKTPGVKKPEVKAATTADDTAAKVQANREKINKLYESFNE